MIANKPNSERGSVIVEAAFTLLLLFTFLLGLVEVGRFISVQQVLTDAAREGARYGVAPLSRINALTPDVARAEAERFLAAAHINGATVCISTADPDNACPTDSTMCPPPMTCTRVRVTAPYQLITLSMFGHFSVTLKGEALMRNETSNESTP